MKTFYIDHVERKGDTTILKCYVVDAETFEEAIALHDSDWENYHGKAVFPPEIAHCAENLVDGWSVWLSIEEAKDVIDFFKKQVEKEQLKKCYHPLTERKHTSDTHFECTICGYNNY